MKRLKIPRILIGLEFLLLGAGCSFKFEMTSQRTALENQIMGSYQELDDDVILLSSVRSVDQEGKMKGDQLSGLQKAAVNAKQNQDFNRDDIDELKSSQILGESNSGKLVFLPEGIGRAASANAEEFKLAKLMIIEENRDREVIWKRIVQSNENLSGQNIIDVQKTYARMQRDALMDGHWYQDDSGQWIQVKKDSAK